MSDKNRNKNSSHGSEENWNQEGRYDQQQHNQQRQYGQQGQYGQQSQYGNSGNVNYDRDNDRNRDNYSGSSYGYAGSSQQDWDRYNPGGDHNQQNQGYSGSNYGSSYGNRRDNDQGNFGGSGYGGSNYGQSGQAGQRGQYGRRDESGYGNSGSSYGNSGGYGGYSRSRNNESGYGNSGNYGGNSGSSDRGNWGNQHRGEDRGWWEKTRDEVSSWFGDDDAERRRRHDQKVSGQHKGKGPRDYRRSDERILEDACDRLSEDSFVDASEIDVKVSGNEVVLTGTVESREAKRRAEDIVESISGVTNVQNNLKVNARHDNSGLRSSDQAR